MICTGIIVYFFYIKHIDKFQNDEPVSTTIKEPTTTTTGDATTTTADATTTTGTSTTTTGTATTIMGTGTATTITVSPPTTTTNVVATTTIPKTTEKPITNKYDDYTIDMMLKGSNNTGNLNDFIAKNTLLGNNLYISPMNQRGIVGDNHEDSIIKKIKKNKIIDSTFTPIIQLG